MAEQEPKQALEKSLAPLNLQELAVDICEETTACWQSGNFSEILYPQRTLQEVVEHFKLADAITIAQENDLDKIDYQKIAFEWRDKKYTGHVSFHEPIVYQGKPCFQRCLFTFLHYGTKGALWDKRLMFTVRIFPDGHKQPYWDTYLSADSFFPGQTTEFGNVTRYMYFSHDGKILQEAPEKKREKSVKKSGEEMKQR